MWLRRAFYWWLVPAAFVLPLWLLIGWGVFNAGGWAFLWVLFLAIPGVFLWQLLVTLLVRARGTVREDRAVSWWDAAGFTVWHVLVISLGFYAQTWWALTLVAAILAGVGLFWLSLWQLWREARPGTFILRTSSGTAYIPPPTESDSSSRGADPDVIVITERENPPRP
jgi:hypothetical protein